MKVKYDKETDILYISLSNEPIAESDEDKPGVILDYSVSGTLIGIEVLNASKTMPKPNTIEMELA
ncbi:DUF2283 domain-containing protein [Spirosoma knui]